MSDKTEDPTPRRLRKAREQGDSAVAASVGQAAGFLVTLLVLPSFFAAIVGGVGAALISALRGGVADLAGCVWLLVLLSLPVLGAAALLSLLLGLLQSGGAFTLGRVAPDFARLNPFTGIKGLLTAERFFSLLRSLFAAVIVGWLAYALLRDHLADVASSAGNGAAIAGLSWVFGRKLLWAAGLVGLVLAAADWFFVRRAWLARHRMTKDEVKREHREAEGDPEVKAARRRAHQDALSGASIAAVRNATVLIVNPTHLATALRYEQSEAEAPLVVAQGEGELARKLIEAAHIYGVPVVRDVPVAHALRELTVGDQIPEALYEAVAEVLRELFDSPDATKTTAL